MLAAPIPHNEAQRLAALFSCGVLDTAPEAAFDDVVQLASHLCEVPIALVSLVDHSRQWFKAKVGLTDSETPRECALCAHAILCTEPLIITDTWLDPRFADNPLVTGEPHVRFYAGMPLVLNDDTVLGTLCVIDHVPRELTPAQLDMLRLLARRVATELSLRRRLRQNTAPKLATS
jgi:GAF domain-containing protein